ncbi:hypothetical protein [Winogradskyella endarachnes]|jgi:hypothetical protein|uniref:Uncharacterized protein n=1 Tax=Winogradskyella endarachnes TaxID=2681965 RepID=A0A6L6U8G3_9FLAO|nr:hypothetical protein [Winogradskyella endarachnes]MUU78458.1 hypothetical protein [Winogradskyella endarachnes]
MKTNIFTTPLLIFIFLIIYEASSFLYKDGFTIDGMDWILILVLPIISLIYNIYKKNKEKV